MMISLRLYRVSLLSVCVLIYCLNDESFNDSFNDSLNFYFK